MVDMPLEKTTGAENVIWDLSIFYKSVDDPAIEQDMQAITKEVDAFAAQYKKLTREFLTSGEGYNPE